MSSSPGSQSSVHTRHTSMSSDAAWIARAAAWPSSLTSSAAAGVMGSRPLSALHLLSPTKHRGSVAIALDVIGPGSCSVWSSSDSSSISTASGDTRRCARRVRAGALLLSLLSLSLSSSLGPRGEGCPGVRARARSRSIASMRHSWMLSLVNVPVDPSRAWNGESAALRAARVGASQAAGDTGSTSLSLRSLSVASSSPARRRRLARSLARIRRAPIVSSSSS